MTETQRNMIERERGERERDRECERELHRDREKEKISPLIPRKISRTAK